MINYCDPLYSYSNGQYILNTKIHKHSYILNLSAYSYGELPGHLGNPFN